MIGGTIFLVATPNGEDDIRVRRLIISITRVRFEAIRSERYLGEGDGLSARAEVDGCCVGLEPGEATIRVRKTRVVREFDATVKEVDLAATSGAWPDLKSFGTVYVVGIGVYESHEMKRSLFAGRDSYLDIFSVSDGTKEPSEASDFRKARVAFTSAVAGVDIIGVVKIVRDDVDQVARSVFDKARIGKVGIKAVPVLNADLSVEGTCFERDFNVRLGRVGTSREKTRERKHKKTAIRSA